MEMNEGIKKILKKGLWVALILFVIRYFIGGLKTVYDYIGAASEVISLTVILLGVYATVLWQFNPFEKLPKIMGRYEGTIEYCFNNVESEKKVTVVIHQTLFTTNVRIVTDEVSSSTITSSFLCENDEYVLYYTYITTPKARISDGNPMQFGTCRLRLEDKDCLIGTYWTSRHTVGDISLHQITK